MPRDVARAALYRGIINLWVEDELTREYLSAVWNDPTAVFFPIGGGNEGVGAVVKDAESAGFPNVFGLIDRDFRPTTNRSHWSSPVKTFRTFVLPVHEIENDLLDPEALAGESAQHPAKDGVPDRRIPDDGGRQIDLVGGLPPGRGGVEKPIPRFVYPRSPLRGDRGRGERDSIISAILTGSASSAQEAARTSHEDMRQLLDVAHHNARSHLTDGNWRIEFAGKEIYRRRREPDL